MDCPHCHQPLPEDACSACGEKIALNSAFCSLCGAPQNHTATEETPAEGAVCGSCYYPLPPDANFCPHCGLPVETEPAEGNYEDADPEGEHDESSFSKRRSCPDGMCVGILGPDGNCLICGKSY